MNPFLFSYGRNHSDNQPTRHQCAWPEFVTWLQQQPRRPASVSIAEYPTLKAYPAKSPEGERLAADKDGAYVVLADCGGGRRALDSLQASYGVPLDFDVPWVTADMIAALLHGYAFVAYTTYAHQTGAERWRVFVPTNTPMDAATHYATWAALNDLFSGAADPAAKDPVRLSYLPGSCLDPSAARMIQGDGAFYAAVPAPPVQPQDVLQSTGPVPGWNGPTDDAELIRIACTTRTRPDERFGGPVHFAMLWAADEAWLAQQYPPRPDSGQSWDMTQADMALAGELAYWTGSDAPRMATLMRSSGLARNDADWQERKVPRAVERAVRGAKQWAFMKAVTVSVPAPPAATVQSVPTAQHLCTDQANAQRLQQHFGNRLIVCAGSFHAWDGTRWKLDDSLAQRYACELSTIVRAEADNMRAQAAAAQQGVNAAELAAHLQHPRLAPLRAGETGSKVYDLTEVADALDTWSKKCEMKNVQDAALGMLKKLLKVEAADLDADPWLLNCANGTLDLRTGALREHRSSDLITKVVPVAYDSAATAPRFQAFMAEIFSGDMALVEFLARWFGYAATGSTREQKLIFHWGKGSNGKTTLIEVIEAVLGDYATTAPPGLLTAKNGDERHPAEIADLHGRRLVTASESEEGSKLREAFIKLTTGGDKLKGRRLYGQLFQFTPTHKLQLLTNHKPEIRGSDFGIWRRILLVPYLLRFGSPDQLAKGDADRLSDPTLKEALMGELPGVLSWLVDGARRWYADGALRPPAVVLAAGAEYRTEQDRVGEFVRDCCRLDIAAWVAVSVLYRGYQVWCVDSGIHPLSRRRFMNEVERAVPGFQSQKRGGIRGVIGLALESPAFGSHPPPPVA